MKTLRQLCAALVLTLAVAVSALADDGHVSCPGIASPPPASTAETEDGHIPCPGVAQALLLTLETVLLLS